MDKKNPLFTATAASVMFFIVFVMLKFTLERDAINWLGALEGSIIFWIIIFIVHQLLNRRHAV